MLKNLPIKRVYSSSTDNLVKDFYNPVLECAVEYSRITGYFSPAVFAISARGMATMLANGGKIRIITSIEVDSKTLEAITSTQKLPDEIIEEYKIPTDPIELRTKLEKDYYSLFVALLKQGTIELKIALTNSGTGILHEKIGIVRDIDGDAISFSGSNNETVYGWMQNIENFKVFTSWDEHTKSYYEDDMTKFENYWSAKNDKVVVLSLDEAIKKRIFKSYDEDSDLDNLVKEIKTQESLSFNSPTKPKRELRDYQKEAIAHWEQENYISVFEMATGSGKTFTALNALKQFKQKHGYLRAVIVVPLVTLVEQWEKDVELLLESVKIIKAAGSNPGWKSDIRSAIQGSKLGADDDFVIITTYSTFGSNSFNELIHAFPTEDLTLLADEMHNLVTENNIKSASSQHYKYKLGLSATPTRLWKPDESLFVKNLFGGRSFVYSLEDAIKSGALVEFEYKVIPVHLTAEEFEEYANLSKEASRLSHFKSDSSKSNPLATVLTKRSIIKKQAENKLLSLDQLISNLSKYEAIQNTLIYVDSNTTLESVQKILTDKHIKTSKFTGNESLDLRNHIIKDLDDKKIEAIVAIKCLDEGVDIPSATTGIFMSNNTDPREYVQRLGRVLRRHEESDKKVAHIYDFLVLPPSSVDTSNSTARNLVKAELRRSIFFQDLAKNSEQIHEDIGKMLDIFGYYFEREEIEGYNSDDE